MRCREPIFAAVSLLLLSLLPLFVPSFSLSRSSAHTKHQVWFMSYHVLLQQFMSCVPFMALFLLFLCLSFCLRLAIVISCTASSLFFPHLSLSSITHSCAAIVCATIIKYLFLYVRANVSELAVCVHSQDLLKVALVLFVCTKPLDGCVGVRYQFFYCDIPLWRIRGPHEGAASRTATKKIAYIRRKHGLRPRRLSHCGTHNTVTHKRQFMLQKAAAKNWWIIVQSPAVITGGKLNVVIIKMNVPMAACNGEIVQCDKDCRLNFWRGINVCLHTSASAQKTIALRSADYWLMHVV